MDRYTNNEAGVVRVVRELLDHDKFSKLYGLPPVLHYEPEMMLARGRADIVVFHADGSITVVELKGPSEMRSILGGIGQLLSYTVQIGLARQQSLVRGLLIAPVEVPSADARLLHESCVRAGMRFEPFPQIRALNENAARLESEYVEKK